MTQNILECARACRDRIRYDQVWTWSGFYNASKNSRDTLNQNHAWIKRTLYNYFEKWKYCFRKWVPIRSRIFREYHCGRKDHDLLFSRFSKREKFHENDLMIFALYDIFFAFFLIENIVTWNRFNEKKWRINVSLLCNNLLESFYHANYTLIIHHSACGWLQSVHPNWTRTLHFVSVKAS